MQPPMSSALSTDGALFAAHRRLSLEQLPLSEPRAAAAVLAEAHRATAAHLAEAEVRLQAEVQLQAEVPQGQGGAASWRRWLATTEAQVSRASQRRLKRFEKRAMEVRLQEAQQALARLSAPERGTSTLLNEVSEGLLWPEL